MIEAIDEQAHEPSASEHAQESWYFNWIDRRHDLFGLARLGYRYHTRAPEPLILTIAPDALALVYTPQHVSSEMEPWDRLDAARGLVAGDMIAIMEEPLKRWRLRLDGPNRMDLLFESYTPVFDYKEAGRELAPTMTTAHFEQSCRVSGWTEFDGKRLEIEGLGQRDKSWGVRVWPRIEGWDWISAQFGEDLSFNLMRTLEGGKAFTNGFVFRDGENFAIRDADLRYEWGPVDQQPARTQLEIVDEGDRRHRISARLRGIFPLPRDPVRLEETYCSFTYRGGAGEGSREGAGVVEHVWRPDAAGRSRG
jgi:hypothetical protein